MSDETEVLMRGDDERRAELYREAAADAEERAQSRLQREAGLYDELRRIRERAAAETGLTQEQLLADGEREIAAKQDEIARAIYTPERRMLLRARVGNKHIRHVGDRQPIECEALTTVREFVDSADLWCLVLSGGLGTRKTGSACWALTRIPGMFVHAQELLDVVFGKKPEYVGLWERLLAAKLVVFDDLGTERADDGGHWAHEFQFLWNRLYENDAKLIVTCNMPAVDKRDPETKQVVQRGFASIYDKRVIDRFREGGRWVSLGGESVRAGMRTASRSDAQSERAS